MHYASKLGIYEYENNDGIVNDFLQQQAHLNNVIVCHNFQTHKTQNTYLQFGNSSFAL